MVIAGVTSDLAEYGLENLEHLFVLEEPFGYTQLLTYCAHLRPFIIYGKVNLIFMKLKNFQVF